MTRWFLLLSLALAGCKTQHVAGECADNTSVPCMTERVCEQDRARGCMRCWCESGEVMPGAGEPPHRDPE